MGIGIHRLDRITDHANKFCKENLNGDNHPLTIKTFPQTLQIYEADINTAFNLKKQQGPRSKFLSGGGGGVKEECVKENVFVKLFFV